MANQNIDEAVEILGKPVYIGFDDNALKVRRNLFIFSSISLFLVITGISVNSKDTVVFGVHLVGVTNEYVYLAFLIFNFYHFIHFLWYAIEAFVEWRLRITGTNTLKSKNDTYRDQYEVFISDPRQSTLYNWYREILPQIQSIVPVAEMAFARVDRMKTYLEARDLNGHISLDRDEIIALHETCNMTLSMVERFTRTYGNPRILKSMKRFDSWYMFLLASHNKRWIVLECFLPLFLGVLSLVLLGIKVIPYLLAPFFN